MVSRILFFILFLGFSINSIAQNNLQLNQIVTTDTIINGSIYWGNGINVTQDIYVVPDGMVCKITSSKIVMYVTSGSNYSNYISQSFKVNNISMSVDGVWLRGGDVISFTTSGSFNNASSSNYRIEMFISIIEYNLISD